MKMSKSIAILASGGVAAAIAAGVYFAFLKPAEYCAPSGVIAGNVEIGGPFQLVTHKGVVVTDKDVITDLSLVYFGYTFCPDVCPLDLARNVAAIDILDEAGIDVTPIFITIDPARDTPEVMSDYVDAMHPKMIGLTGAADQVAQASKAYKTYYHKNGDSEDYLMDHSTFSYLMSPEGFLDYLPRDLTPEDVAKKAACFSK